MDFLELEAEQGTMAASRVLEEELALYRIMVFHNLLDCPNCSPWLDPVMVSEPVLTQLRSTPINS